MRGAAETEGRRWWCSDVVVLEFALVCVGFLLAGKHGAEGGEKNPGDQIAAIGGDEGGDEGEDHGRQEGEDGNKGVVEEHEGREPVFSEWRARIGAQWGEMVVRRWAQVKDKMACLR